MCVIHINEKKTTNKQKTNKTKRKRKKKKEKNIIIKGKK